MTDETVRPGKLNKAMFRAILILTVLSGLLVVFMVFWHFDEKNQIKNVARNIAVKRAALATEEIGTILLGSVNENALRTTANTIAEGLTTGVIAHSEIKDVLEQAMQNQSIGSVTAAYVPGIVEGLPPTVGASGLYAPFWARGQTNELYSGRVEDSYNYTLPDQTPGDDGNPIPTNWYHRALDANQGAWNGPYQGRAAPGFWAGYGTPFYLTPQRNVVAGVVSVDARLEGIQDQLPRKLDSIFGGGTEEGAWYGFILSSDGNFLYHPNKDLSGREISAFDSELAITEIQNAANNSGNGSSVLINHVDEDSKQPSWILFTRLSPFSGWVGVVIDRGDIFRINGIDRLVPLQRTGLALSTMLFLLLLASLLLRVHSGTTTSIWAVSFLFSLLSLAGIAFLWFSNITSDADLTGRNIPLITRATVPVIEADLLSRQDGRRSIPTGVFVQSIQFSSANNVTVTGFIWQRFSKNSPDMPESPAPLGVIFPESDETTSSESYRLTPGDDVVIGWEFKAVLRQQFDYSRYPFDREEVWLRMWYKDFNEDVILIPDLDSYSTMNPQKLPGLEQEDFVIEGWEITKTFFSYRKNSYNTKFGASVLNARDNFPELYFNVGMKRQFHNAFVSNFIPVIVIAILLFAVALMATSVENRERLFGFTTSSVLTFGAALFFVVIISHTNLRLSLSAGGIIYIEAFYFVLYGAILSVSTNAILVASNLDIRFIRYRQNLIMKVLYWPALLGILLAFTILVFTFGWLSIT